VVESICTPNWADSLRNLSTSAFGPNRTFKLSEKPEPADAPASSCAVDGVQVGGWHYDAGTNSVVFDQDAAPPPGSVVEITYSLGCD